MLNIKAFEEKEEPLLQPDTTNQFVGSERASVVISLATVNTMILSEITKSANGGLAVLDEFSESSCGEINSKVLETNLDTFNIRGS